VKSRQLNADNVTAYASFLARRYRERPNIVWLVGGDARGNEQIDVWNALGRTLRAEDHNHLITYHPLGRAQSSTWFHAESWLAFNMFQSGHQRYDQDTGSLRRFGEDNWRYVLDDLAKSPPKPVLDGEPSYENIPQAMASWITTTGLTSFQFLLVVNLLLLLAGNVMEPSSIVLIMAPILFPIAVTLGVDPVHFGVLITLNMEIGMCHPPVGLNLYVASGIAKMGITELTIAVWPWLVGLLLFLVVVTYWPALSLALPRAHGSNHPVSSPSQYPLTPAISNITRSVRKALTAILFESG
jgi:hypothetical protein